MNLSTLNETIDKCTLCFGGDASKRKDDRGNYSESYETTTALIYSTDEMCEFDASAFVDEMSLRIDGEVTVFPDIRCKGALENKKDMCMIFTRLALHNIFRMTIIMGSVRGYESLQDYGKRRFKDGHMWLKVPVATPANASFIIDAMEKFLS